MSKNKGETAMMVTVHGFTNKVVRFPDITLPECVERCGKQTRTQGHRS